LQDIDAGPVNAYKIALSPTDGKNLVAGSNTGELTVFDVDKGEKVARLNSQGKFAMSVTYSPDGTRVASGAIDGAVTLFDLTTGKQGSVQHQFTEGVPMLAPIRARYHASSQGASTCTQ
jgi:WD40 repeat protein